MSAHHQAVEDLADDLHTMAVERVYSSPPSKALFITILKESK
jgi:hypothetical protein